MHLQLLFQKEQPESSNTIPRDKTACREEREGIEIDGAVIVIVIVVRRRRSSRLESQEVKKWRAEDAKRKNQHVVLSLHLVYRCYLYCCELF